MQSFFSSVYHSRPFCPRLILILFLLYIQILENSNFPLFLKKKLHIYLKLSVCCTRRTKVTLTIIVMHQKLVLFLLRDFLLLPFAMFREIIFHTYSSKISIFIFDPSVYSRKEIRETKYCELNCSLSYTI
jgi:hypothetical protein